MLRKINERVEQEMEISLWCPICKQELHQTLDAYYCKRCGSSYRIKDGYVDFIDKDFYAGEVSRVELNTLLSGIDQRGYEPALETFFTKYPRLREYILDVTRADWQCHCVGTDLTRCLDIGSGLGNISENLSNNFEEVYSLEAVAERIEFQKRRYENSDKKNIILIRGNAMQLPFPDNFFDFVVCNGVLEWVAMLNPSLEPREAQSLFLREIKRVLSTKGCVYIGIENRFGFPFILGAVDHSGIRYTSLIPRRIASFIVKRQGRAGGIYGDTTNRKETRGYVTYTYSLSGYKKLFREVGFKTKSFWVIPSYNNPRISARTEDINSLKGYIRHFLNTNDKFRLPLSVLYKLDKSIIRALGNLLTPSFLFFCYKDQIPASFDDTAMLETKLSSFVTISTGRGVMYILYDKMAKASRIVHLKRPKYGPRNNIPLRDKSMPELRDFKGDVWQEQWITGRQLNPLKLKESKLALKWLFNYQMQNSGAAFSKDDIKSQVNQLKIRVSSISEMRMDNYCNFFDNYESYLCNINLKKVREHGDFFYSNILIEDSNSLVHIIDWEYCREDGDPFFDLVFYILTALELPTRSPNDFRNNLSNSGKFVRVLKYLKPMIDQHYGQKIDIDKLLPYTLIRFIVRKYIERGKFDGTVIHYKKILDILASQKLNLDL